MISEEQQDQAALYVLGLLESGEIAEFEAATELNPELRELVRELQQASASLALSCPARLPPPELKDKVMRQTAISRKEHSGWPLTWVPWAIAACLAIACGVLFLGRARFSQDIAELERRIATLTSERDQAMNMAAQDRHRAEAATSQVANLSAERGALANRIKQLEEREAASRIEAATLTSDRDALKQKVTELQQNANVQIVTLKSKMNTAPQALATIVWDGAKQQGTFRGVNLPPTAADRNYQLWIVDPRYKSPVDAGIFSVKEGGATQIVFRPKLRIASANAFAVSLERKGGVAKAEGPIVLAGE